MEIMFANLCLLKLQIKILVFMISTAKSISYYIVNMHFAVDFAVGALKERIQEHLLFEYNGQVSRKFQIEWVL